jgi:hypothetical protein
MQLVHAISIPNYDPKLQFQTKHAPINTLDIFSTLQKYPVRTHLIHKAEAHLEKPKSKYPFPQHPKSRNYSLKGKQTK